MSRFLTILTVAVFVLLTAAGCDDSIPVGSNQSSVTKNRPDDPGTDQPPQPDRWTIQLSDGSVEISRCSYDYAAHVMTARIDHSYTGVSLNDLSLRIQNLTESQSGPTAALALISTSGGLLFEIEYALSQTDSTWCRVTERTQEDILAMTRRVPGDSIVEDYSLNGLTRTYVYSSSVIEYLEGGNIGVSLDDATLNYIDSVQTDFGQFIQGATTLADNPAGKLLVEIVSSPGFQTWLRSSCRFTFGDDELSKSLITRTDICTIAAICARFKCLLGGWANPLCHACVGVGAACLIASAVEMVIGWFD